MRFVSLALALLAAMPALGSVSVKRSAEKPKTLDVAIVDEPLSVAVKALSVYLSRRVQLLVSDEPNVTYSAKQIAPEAALRAIAAAADVALTVQQNQFWIRNDSDPTVTIDVKDQDVRTILKSMQKQCHIKNLVIDPGVQGTGTFLFDHVPCRTAFTTVFRTLSLNSVDYGNSVITVGVRR